MDGLLIDSEPLWYEVESAMVQQLGGVWGPEHQAACAGGTLHASCRYIIDLTGAAIDVDELGDRLFAAMLRSLRRTVPVVDAATALIDGVRDRGVRTGLVSSSYRPLVDAVLHTLGRARFDVTVAGDEVAHGKPAPDPYRLACERLAVDPARVVVLEDAPLGVQSAEAAGCVVVAVPSVAPIDATPARPVVDSLTAIDVDWLLGLPRASSATRHGASLPDSRSRGS